MIPLVTVEEAREWLGVIHDADDGKIDAAILASSQAVLDYLDVVGEQNSDDEPVFYHAGVPIEIGEVERVATLLMVRRIYDGELDGLEYGRLPNDVTSMLYVRRIGIAFA